VLVPDDDTNASPLVLQQVPEPKVGKNRMHLDIVADDIEPEVTRLESLGARRLHDGVQNIDDTQWVTLADPEGNEFCVCTASSTDARRRLRCVLDSISRPARARSVAALADSLTASRPDVA